MEPASTMKGLTLVTVRQDGRVFIAKMVSFRNSKDEYIAFVAISSTCFKNHVPAYELLQMIYNGFVICC
jgi:hypothetical protein